MRVRLFAVALCLPLAALAQQLPTKPAAKDAAKSAVPATGPVATVNGVAIPRLRLDQVVRQQTARGAQDNEQLRAQVREALINNELLVQEASRSGLTKKPDVQQQIELNRLEVIANAMVADYVRAHPVSDGDIQKEYDRARQQTGDREYRARHILVASEDEAKAVLAELKKGAKFEELAQKRSTDEGTKARGGDLDWNVPGNFDKAFATAMVKLDKGKTTDVPVRSRFGFHVIQLEDQRTVTFPPLAQVKPQIQQRLTRQKVETLLRDLRTKAKVE